MTLISPIDLFGVINVYSDTEKWEMTPLNGISLRIVMIFPTASFWHGQLNRSFFLVFFGGGYQTEVNATIKAIFTYYNVSEVFIHCNINFTLYSMEKLVFRPNVTLKTLKERLNICWASFLNTLITLNIFCNTYVFE